MSDGCPVMADVVFNNGELEALLRGPSGAVAQTILKATLAVEREAKHLCPVDTGRLRSSITPEVAREGQEIVGRVGTNVEYAPYQEFGTRFQHGTPFLRPALSAAQRYFR